LNVETVRRQAPDVIGFQELQSGNLDTYEEKLPQYRRVLGPRAGNKRAGWSFAHNVGAPEVRVLPRGYFSACHKPLVEFCAVVAWGAGREVVLWDALPRSDLLERLDRLAPKVPGGLLRGHPLGPLHTSQVLCCSERFSAASVSARATPESAVASIPSRICLASSRSRVVLESGSRTLSISFRDIRYL
jgi:hypothetical protein